MKIPEWPLPTDLKRWQQVDRAQARATLLKLLGEMPARPDPAKVKVLTREDQGDYILERFGFHNDVDMVVPGILLIPKNRKGPVPAVVGLHGHGGSKESICTDAKSSQLIGPMLAKKGYVVAAIDGDFAPGRLGKGPGGKRENAAAQEASRQPVRGRAEGERESRPPPATPGDGGARTGQAAGRRQGAAVARSADRAQGAAEG
jgi:hypothetical protein